MIYKRRSYKVEALQWTGSNLEEIMDFLGKAFIGDYDMYLVIDVARGCDRLKVGDWVVKDSGEFITQLEENFPKNFKKVKGS